MSLQQRVVDMIHRHALLRDGPRVLVALSGGADSVALLFLLRELDAAGELRLAGAAHLNHLLRGADADEDAAFCAALTARLGIPLALEHADVRALARAQKRSLEAAARAARLAFFDRAAAQLGADVVATAHTRDDQAETFLLRLLRGAGARGLGGIRPRSGRVIRPALEIDRDDLRTYLTSLGESWREDATNADVSILRNRVRHELIPLLRSRFSPAVAGVLAREAALARVDEDFLRDGAIELARRIVLSDERSQITLDTAGLAAAPRALSSRVVLQALERLAGGQPISYEHVDAVLRLGPGQAVSLPGQEAVRTGDAVVFRARHGREGSSPLGLRTSDARHRTARHSARHSDSERGGGNAFSIPLSIPGEVEFAAANLALRAERLDDPGGRPRKWDARGAEVGVAAERLVLPLAVRGRRPGDRFHPLGGPGVRKLQDFFVDRKVARFERDRVPLVVDGRDRIVWVVGQSVAEEFRVTDASRGVILLQVRHLGGVG